MKGRDVVGRERASQPGVGCAGCRRERCGITINCHYTGGGAPMQSGKTMGYALRQMQAETQTC